ncbi:hypothetical protein GCM10020358_70200 [Amorphoplanes nipponensis]|uniref:Beta-lactamase n=1 Tax=Actinoplanes nipponensis TaxID=135950 RepID=A0A919JKR8_9ACTN|nr:beta-lactamase family protein [Actinoplanes nipponensis]GIE51145.1 hypothetical protein Ani05nite_46790 [Actinoplanes nipponensis]
MSKQFTAAAVLLLARDGTLSVDDRVSLKYAPGAGPKSWNGPPGRRTGSSWPTGSSGRSG